ncbi:MAG: hypothetical protein ACPL3A_09920 [Thermoanaerobacteraceae bacterium]
MTNLERLKLEIKGIDYSDDELTVYLLENGLNSTDIYDPQNKINHKNILKTALAILESVANNPQLMKTYKTDDITIMQFSENLQNRIDALEKKIRQISIDDTIENSGGTFTYLFSK